jgi:hypothetical protein
MATQTTAAQKHEAKADRELSRRVAVEVTAWWSTLAECQHEVVWWLAQIGPRPRLATSPAGGFVLDGTPCSRMMARIIGRISRPLAS